MDQRPIAVVLVSGGMDSCVTLALANRTHDVAALHVNYGQRTEERELRAFQALSGHYDVPGSRRLVVDQKHLAMMGGSVLTDVNLPIPVADLECQTIPSTYVPFRNANLLAAAASWAEVLGAKAIYVGAVEEDSSGYPDCRREFFDAYEQAITAGTRPETGISIETPIIAMSKAEIVRLGNQLKAPLGLTWSCYQDDETPCGRCDSCALRARGFAGAGVEDPLLSML